MDAIHLARDPAIEFDTLVTHVRIRIRALAGCCLIRRPRSGFVQLRDALGRRAWRADLLR